MTQRRTPKRRSTIAAGHRATGRVLDILELLARNPEGFTLTELSAKLTIPKSSLLVLLRTFAERAFLEHRPTGGYRLGPKAIDVGMSLLSQRELPSVARPGLVDLMEKSGETTFLGILANDAPEVVYIDKVESNQRIRYTASLGERRPLYGSAPGIAIFAFLPTAQREAYLSSLDLRPLTARTITDRTALRARLDEVRRTGVAISNEEFLAGASAVAAPVFDPHGRVVATCTVVGPSARILAQQASLTEWVRAAANGVSKSLGSRSGAPDF
jgi:DNA-binding IclR family transcriptional regulator